VNARGVRVAAYKDGAEGGAGEAAKRALAGAPILLLGDQHGGHGGRNAQDGSDVRGGHSVDTCWRFDSRLRNVSAALCTSSRLCTCFLSHALEFNALHLENSENQNSKM